MQLPLPDHDSCFWKQGRLKKYNNWPFKTSDKCNIENMAAAGFYFIGNSDEPDLVECFICGKQLDGWEPDDDPWNEHLKHQKNCPFIKLNKQDELKWTVDELYYLYKKYKTKEVMQILNKNIILTKDEAKQLNTELLSVYTSQKNKNVT